MDGKKILPQTKSCDPIELERGSRVVDQSALMRPSFQLDDLSSTPPASPSSFLLGGHRQLVLENPALRPQLAVYRRTVTGRRSQKVIASSASGAWATCCA